MKTKCQLLYILCLCVCACVFGMGFCVFFTVHDYMAYEYIFINCLLVCTAYILVLIIVLYIISCRLSSSLVLCIYACCWQRRRHRHCSYYWRDLGCCYCYYRGNHCLTNTTIAHVTHIFGTTIILN